MADSATNDEIIAFRLRAHHLDERLSHNSLLDAAGACGIQNSPPGSALTALHARGAVRIRRQRRRPDQIRAAAPLTALL